MNWWELSDLSTPWSVHVVATLGVPEQLNGGPKEIGALAAACGAHADSLARVLRHLISKGLFAEPSPGLFALNDVARDLLHPGAKTGLNLDGFGGRMAYAWGSLLTAVRTGEPAYHTIFGKPYWEDLAANPKIADQFDELMGAGHGTPDPDVLLSGWAGVRHVVDVGGGTGSLLAEVLRAQPEVRGTLVDLPSVVAKSVSVFQAAGVAARVNTAAQSFFDPLPAGADVYTIKSVLCDWPDGGAGAILKRCAEAARPSAGRVVAVNGVNPDQEGPADPNLLMLVLVGGKNRTLSEFRELAAAAGLEVTASGRNAAGRFMVECRPR
jgi:hypothetical protein